MPQTIAKDVDLLIHYYCLKCDIFKPSIANSRIVQVRKIGRHLKAQMYVFASNQKY